MWLRKYADTMSLSAALETLANYRANNTRASQETFDKGAQILKSNAISRLGSDCKQYSWSVPWRWTWCMDLTCSVGLSRAAYSSCHRYRKTRHCGCRWCVFVPGLTLRPTWRGPGLLGTTREEVPWVNPCRNLARNSNRGDWKCRCSASVLWPVARRRFFQRRTFNLWGYVYLI